MVKRTTPAYTEDQVKEAILAFLHEKWKNAAGVKSSKPQISEIREALKEKGMEQKEVRRNLQYLIDTNWVKQEVRPSTFHTGKRMVSTDTVSYMISSQGIDYFEGRSKFEKREGLAGIRIENVSGVVIIGNNNYVRQEYQHLFKSLDELDSKIRMTDELGDEKKLDYSSDVHTIQSQLSKANPDKGIISRAWNKIKEIAPIVGLANVVRQVGEEIVQQIGNLPPPS